MAVTNYWIVIYLVLFCRSDAVILFFTWYKVPRIKKGWRALFGSEDGLIAQNETFSDNQGEGEAK